MFRILGDLEQKPELIVLLIQKEVAERICALRRAQGKPQMNLFSASVQIWAESKIIGYVSRDDFSPPPKVDSAIIRLLPTRIYTDKNTDLCGYYKFIKILFKQPRKTIVNNLLSGIMNNELRIINKQEIVEKLKEIGVEPNARPQDLSVEQIQKMVNFFYSYV